MKLNLGCGPIHLPGWINIDHEPKHNPDIQLDVLNLAEHFEENSAGLVFGCHFLEHLEFPAGIEKCLGAILRVLKPGGVLRLVVPDLMKVARLYVGGDDLKGIYDGPYHEGPDCPATRFMYFARAWNHTVLFDDELLGMMLAAAGFVEIYSCAFGQSDVEELRYIDRFESESISVEASKP